MHEKFKEVAKITGNIDVVLHNDPLASPSIIYM